MFVILQGYAALFDVLDNGGDIITRGAFAKSLRAIEVQGIPLLLRHNAKQQLGMITIIWEDQIGLYFRCAVPRWEKAWPFGLSFGYRAKHITQEKHMRSDCPEFTRSLHQIDLIEISLVDDPMQPLARLDFETD